MSPPSIATKRSICGEYPGSGAVTARASCATITGVSSSSLRSFVVKVTDLVSPDGNVLSSDASAMYSVPEDSPLSLSVATSSAESVCCVDLHAM